MDEVKRVDWTKNIVAYCDGGSRGNPGPSACAFAVCVGGELVHSQAKYLGDDKTNNYAEYMGLIELLRCLHGLHRPAVEETEWRQAVKRVLIYLDSELVINQVNGTWKINKPEFRELAAYAHGLVVRGQHTLMHCDGHSGIIGNELCDQLCNEEMDKHAKAVS